MGEALDLELLRSWIGREQSDIDMVTPELVKRFRATLDLAPAEGEDDRVPLALHWCLAPPAVPMAGLGPDGHPARGGFLPPVPLPRRMWAGGALEFDRPIRCGDLVRRVSRIDNVTVKDGRSGSLCFVTVSHTSYVGEAVAVRERQDIVYRGAAAPAAPAGVRATPAEPAPRWSRTATAGPVQLFRYSALTFNGHRIHYDRRYCREEEGYPGLVVHGPLQATLLLHYAAELRGGAAPTRFAFRSEAPIFDDTPFVLAADETGEGLALRTVDAQGRTAMWAEATWS